MLRSCPILVIYAELNILATYILTLDLNHDELPLHVSCAMQFEII